MSKSIKIATCILLLATFLTSCSDDPAMHAYQKADELLSKGQYAKAINAYRHIVDKYNESLFAPQSQYKIGQVYHLFLNNGSEAIKSYETLILLYPYSKEVLLARKDLAYIYIKQGNFQKAIGEYQWLMRNSRGKEREEFHYEIAMCYIQMPDTNQARIEFNELIKNTSSDELRQKTYYQIANTFYLEAKYKDAVNAYDQIIKNYPESQFALEARFNKAKSLEEMDNLREALSLYRTILDKYPNRDAVKERISGIETRIRQGR